MPIPQAAAATRRKSSTWNKFNLKRQLSKVDMKLKTTFSGSENLREKRNSVFYSEVSPSSEGENVEDNTSPDSDDNTVIDNQSVIDLSVSPKSTQVHRIKESEREGFLGDMELSPEEDSELFHVGSLESSKKCGLAANRPANLDLIDDNGYPVPPPRHLKKKMREKRDQRLLSVPNIKFQKAELQSYRDLRDKEDVIVSPQPSFPSNLMRRFSKS